MTTQTWYLDLVMPTRVLGLSRSRQPAFLLWTRLSTSVSRYPFHDKADEQACILVSAWSAGNSYCYVGSRIIVAMAVDKQLPQVSGMSHALPIN